MKGILAVLFILAFVATGFSFEYPSPTIYKAKDADETEGICPETQITTNCMSCHTMVRGDGEKYTLGLKEIPLEAGLNLPDGAKLVYQGDDIVLRYVISSINDNFVEELFRYLSWHKNIKHIIFEVHSSGGSIFDAKRIIAHMDKFKNNGGIIETHCPGWAGSAGFLVFINGTKGYRFIHPYAELMLHELWTFEF
ncbi:MAG: ATP-dependent Clp protease proteolytic subunit, partial [Candidatus Hodarchaeales archaeon]